MRKNGSNVTVSASFSNQTLGQGYYVRNLGLYANDPQAGEILYSISVADESTATADYMPPFNGSIIYSARYGRTKLTTSKIIAALEVVIGTYLLYLLLNLVLYGCTYGLQGWNVSIQSSLHYASSIYNLTFLQMFFISVILNIFGIVALTTITLFLSAQMSSPVIALITSCVICFLPVVFDFNDSLPVLQKMQEICPIFMLHTNGIFSDMKTYFGMSQPVFMIILNVGLIFVFYRLTKNISKKHQVTG